MSDTGSEKLCVEGEGTGFTLVPGGSKDRARPFVKWAGGKAQLLSELIARRPQEFNRYIEPFVGGGAFFFAAQPQQGLLADVNPDLMNTYRVVRDNVEELIANLSDHVYEKDYYYDVRNVDRSADFAWWGDVRKASRFIFLNKTCFNGLYRVNSKGQFNTPFGRYKDPKICDSTNLRACSQALQKIELLCCPFHHIEEHLQEGDFLYLDPPYAPVSDTANFTQYVAGGFSAEDQADLAAFCGRLSARGVKFMLSNAAVDNIRELYSTFQIETVHAARAINSVGGRRGKVEEFIVTNYDYS